MEIRLPPLSTPPGLTICHIFAILRARTGGIIEKDASLFVRLEDTLIVIRMIVSR